MALDARTHQEIYNSVFGRTDYEPIVHFFDHATYNEELTKQSGRPRYTEQTYTSIKPTHPDLRVRDVVCHPTTEEEKRQYPEQWSRYLETQHEGVEFKPPLQAIPGMKVSYFNELKDLEIYNAEDLANHEGDLDELNWLKELAKRIMELSNEARDLREGRVSVRGADSRPAYEASEGDRGSVITPIGGKSLREEVTKEKGGEEKGNQEESFSYSFSMTGWS